MTPIPCLVVGIEWGHPLDDFTNINLHTTFIYRSIVGRPVRDHDIKYHYWLSKTHPLPVLDTMV